MKRSLSLLLIASALGSGSAAIAGGQGLFLVPDVGLASRAVPSANLTLIDGDEDEDGGWLWSWSGDEDEDEQEAGDARMTDGPAGQVKGWLLGARIDHIDVPSVASVQRMA